MLVYLATTVCATSVEVEWYTLMTQKITSGGVVGDACTAINTTGDITQLCACMAGFTMEQVPDCDLLSGSNVMDGWKSCQSTSTEAGNAHCTCVIN